MPVTGRLLTSSPDRRSYGWYWSFHIEKPEITPMKYSQRSLAQFSTRGVLWLMLVAACLCGWWVNRRQFVSEKRAAAPGRKKATTLQHPPKPASELGTGGKLYHYPAAPILELLSRIRYS